MMTPRVAGRAALPTVLAFALCAGLPPTAALAQRSGVRVRHERPEIHRIEFVPNAPPPGMPKLTPPESGVCNTTFELETGVSYSAETLTPTQVRITVVELELTTRIRFDIYTLKDAPQKLRDHEEAHRRIGEYYYKNSATVAGDIGRALLGESYDGAGADEDAAQKNAVDKVLASIENDYMARTRDRSAAANVRFDLITNHGLDPIDESVAFTRAVESDPEPDPGRRRR
jgi:hypothetical protein